MKNIRKSLFPFECSLKELVLTRGLPVFSKWQRLPETEQTIPNQVIWHEPNFLPSCLGWLVVFAKVGELDSRVVKKPERTSPGAMQMGRKHLPSQPIQRSKQIQPKLSERRSCCPFLPPSSLLQQKFKTKLKGWRRSCGGPRLNSERFPGRTLKLLQFGN